jgi:hypothetical protein
MRTQPQSTTPGHDDNSSHARMPSRTRVTNNLYARSPAPSTHLVGHRHRAGTHILNTHLTTPHLITTKHSAPAYPLSSPPPPPYVGCPSPASLALSDLVHPVLIPPPSAWSPNPSLSAPSPKNLPSPPPHPAQQAALPLKSPNAKTSAAAARTGTLQRKREEPAQSSRTLVPRCLPGSSALVSSSSSAHSVSLPDMSSVKKLGMLKLWANSALRGQRRAVVHGKLRQPQRGLDWDCARLGGRGVRGFVPKVYCCGKCISDEHDEFG